jgi:two-component system phosphate regulon sensor histidine kinase PhoR
MTFALLGVVAIQISFLTESYDLQSKLFDRSVNEALANVVSTLTKQDANRFLKQRVLHEQQANKTTEPTNEADNRPVLVKDSVTTKGPLTKRERRLALLRDSLKRMIASKKMDDALGDITQSGSFQIRITEFTDVFGITHLTPELVGVAPTNYNPNQKAHKFDTIRYYVDDPQYGRQLLVAKRINPIWQQQQLRKKKERQMQQVKKALEAESMQASQTGKPTVMQNLIEEYQKSGEPLAERLNSLWIDSLLRFELRNKGIDLPFSYQVSTANTDSLIFSKANDLTGKKPVFIASNTYQTPIFSKEVINDPGLIRLSFPQKSSLILSHMKVNMATTAGLLFVLILCFGYTIFSIIRQKKISEMKTDFINNMTHEFKTPVSTIMIASEALKDDEIANDKTRISRLANIIYEENARLGSHIERVLNIARIDKNDFKLEKKPVDINEMVTVVLDSMALKLQKSNTEIVLNLDAENAIINADELHFSNVLYNLIDNAIKYSQGTPHITISTFNKNNHIVIKVADKGIGMGRDQQAKIFEQFYRIPTGNLHDVKGFGLGLSYVNTIVKRLNGTIAVRSEKDKGSEFEIKFSVA